MTRTTLRPALITLVSLSAIGCMPQPAPRFQKGPSIRTDLEEIQPRVGEIEEQVAYEPSFGPASGSSSRSSSGERDDGYWARRARYSPQRAQLGDIPPAPGGSSGTLGEAALNGESAVAPSAEAGTLGEIPGKLLPHSLDSLAVQAPPQPRSYAELVRGRAETRSYRSPLAVGNPGESASLYRESRSLVNDLYHDYRAFQPMDLITVVITEVAEGNRIANTNSKQESSFSAAITGLLGLDDWFFGRNKGLDPNAVIGTDTESEFKGQGQMLRSDRLKGTISAMVTEVLPTGILRIEGKKVIAVNSEEQVMVISGLVRPRDVSSANTVESNKIANVRIDFFGKGTLGDIQSPGWFVEMLNWLWPF